MVFQMRICFVLQTYRAPGQIGRLVDALNRGCPGSLIVVSHSGVFPEFAEWSRCHRISRILPAVPGRGHFGLIDSYTSALRWLRRQDLSYDWIVLMSGQDYPIRPLEDFCALIERSDVDGYFYHFDPAEEPRADGQPMAWTREEVADRYLYRYALLKDELSLAERAVLKVPRGVLACTRNYRLHTSFGLRFGRRVDEAPFSTSFRLYGGSYWHIIRRECADAVLDFIDAHPNIVDYFRHVILPDETFIQTVLLNDNRFCISSRDLRYFDFGGSHYGHPKTLGLADLQTVFASNCYLARKFDAASHPTILDILDARV